MLSRLPVVAAIVGTIGFLFALGCGDDGEEILITNVHEQAPNEPPIIIDFGPDWGSEPIENINGYYGFKWIDPWVIVGDPNGLDDIMAVMISVDSVVVQNAVARRDTSGPGFYCARISFEDSDTLNINSLIVGSYSGAEDLQMRHGEGGRFEGCCIETGSMFSLHGPCFPDLMEGSDSLGLPPKPCAYGDYSVEVLGIYPQGADSTISAVITNLQVEYRGISVIVYDAVGQSATVSIPDLTMIYTSEEEIYAAP